MDMFIGLWFIDKIRIVFCFVKFFDEINEYGKWWVWYVMFFNVFYSYICLFFLEVEWKFLNNRGYIG